jgi:hypothetical protein
MKHYLQNQCLNPRCALKGQLDERSVSMLVVRRFGWRVLPVRSLLRKNWKVVVSQRHKLYALHQPSIILDPVLT